MLGGIVKQYAAETTSEVALKLLLARCEHRQRLLPQLQLGHMIYRSEVRAVLTAVRAQSVVRLQH